MPEQTPLAEVAYQAYGSATNHKNFRGDPMPAWDELPDAIKHAWTVAADAILTSAQPSKPAQSEYGQIQISRHLGRGIVIDTAPEHAKAYIGILASTGNGVSVEDDAIRIADQVLYQVTGYDPADATLTLRLVHDWRPGHSDDPAPEALPDETCTTFSEHGWGRCVEPHDHPPGKHMHRNPQRKQEG
jgi:hypothetical protein